MPEPRRPRHPAAPTPKPPVDRGTDAELLELQRSAGNRAVTEAITSVQRHRLNPENIDELLAGLTPLGYRRAARSAYSGGSIVWRRAGGATMGSPRASP